MHTHSKRVNIVTLGCSKNVVDSEKIAGHLFQGGYHISHNAEVGKFDTVIINTCGFIESSKQESINHIIGWTAEKQAGTIDKLIVTGCLSHRYQKELAIEFKNVDAWFGTMELGQLLHTMQVDYKTELVGARVFANPQHYAYVKISEGCNRACTFCAIPLMRGGHISRPIDELVAEVAQLAQMGVKEIMLIAQELTYYGLDIYKKRSLDSLLHSLVQVEGIEWIRLHYAYPHKFPLSIIETMGRYEKICNYLDMPLQHASDDILRAMQRHITQAEMRTLLKDIRSILPDITLRTTMIVGFPSETDTHFGELLDFVEEQRFDRLGVFTYSHEESTKAFALQDDVTSSIKQQRYATLMHTQQKISLEKNEAMISKKVKTIVDRSENGIFIGRTEKDSPEVDNEVLIFNAPQHILVGSFLEAEINGATEYDLEATFLRLL